MDALRHILPATTSGDIHSLVVNPAGAAPHWPTGAERETIGISAGTFRVSVAIEDAKDQRGGPGPGAEGLQLTRRQGALGKHY